jgi:hypothetical protein
MVTQSSEAVVVDQINYNKVLDEHFPKPETNGYDQDTPYAMQQIRRHCELVLHASNEVHGAIDSHSWDHLTAEQVFNEIHFIHVGKADPVNHIIASADFDTRESSLPYDIWSVYADAAKHLGKDGSYQKGRYRSTAIDWREPQRGILGLAAGDLPHFANEFFSHIDSVIAETSLSGGINPEAARHFAIVAATILDVAHLKKDCNGRACEDFMVWLEKKLINKPEEIRFLSGSGLRARGLHSLFSRDSGGFDKLLKPEYFESSAAMRKNIDEKCGLVLEVRRQLYDRLAENLGIQPHEVESKLPRYVAANSDEKTERDRVWSAATTVLLEEVAALEEVDKLTLRRDKYTGLVQFIQEKGVSTYTELRDEDVF